MRTTPEKSFEITPVERLEAPVPIPLIFVLAGTYFLLEGDTCKTC